MEKKGDKESERIQIFGICDTKEWKPGSASKG